MHMVLSNKLDEFVDRVFADDIDSIIKILGESNSSGNCLHIAIQKYFPNLRAMVDKCANDTYALNDRNRSNDDMPRHIATKQLNLQTGEGSSDGIGTTWVEPSEVEIAVIDDGIDATTAGLQPRIARGATSCPYPHSSELVNSYFVPSGKHGTLMAQLVCRLCPDVKLYIARLE
ncbi:hypothetical protein F4861DRAFT_88862 [Xylaria intraflava]|nr:hypothetical protein F4861DRAFT_88862 [Xylaria intraflava]